MAAIKRNKQMAKSRGRWTTLQIRNIGDDTAPRDLVELFSREQFDLSRAYVELIGSPRSCLAQGFISVREREATKAKNWANGMLWRGQKLDVAIDDWESFVDDCTEFSGRQSRRRSSLWLKEVH